MKTRIFVTLHTLSDENSTRYHKEKKEFDFPEDVNIEACYAEIHDKFGMIGRDNRADKAGNRILAPMKYAVIHGHKKVDETRERVVIPEEKCYEVPLLSGKMLNDCLMDSPNIGLKRRKKK